MAIPTTAPAARPCFPPQAPLPAAAAVPRRFTVQVSPQVYVDLPLPTGLDAAGAERYVRAYALSRGHDCRLERLGAGRVYCLSDGARFEAFR